MRFLGPPMRPRLLFALLLVALVHASAITVAPESVSAARRQVPFGWLGVTASGPALSVSIDLSREMDVMVSAGVESVRPPVYWNEAQPDPYTTDFSLTDRFVAAAAAHGLRVMPVVVGTPGWAALRAGDPYSPPRSPDTYARYLRLLVARYGPRGAFWSEHPGLARVPIRTWQVWNEPNLTIFWSVQPFARGYVRLLRAARDAIKAADPGATVVLAGLVNSSWLDLAKVYQAGGRRYFDMAAVHPYTFFTRNVVRIVALNRSTMASYGDARKPIVVSELSWPSGRGYVRQSFIGKTLTEQGQAQRVAQVLPWLATARRRYRIAQVAWFTWLSPALGSQDPFDYSGLRRLKGGTVFPKPALAAFQTAARRLEGCAKSVRATRCAR
jgi:hypothetical protein